MTAAGPSGDSRGWPYPPKGPEAQLRSILFQLNHTQWWSAEALRRHQAMQAGRLLAQAVRHVPYYRARLGGLGLEDGRPIDAESWRSLPILTRAGLQESGDTLAARKIAKQHLPISTVSSSGSTGRRVTVRKTGVAALMWTAITLREIAWHRRDTSLTLAAIRNEGGARAAWPDGLRTRSWGYGARLGFPTGPGLLLPVNTPVDRQLEWLRRQDAAYLLTHPTNLEALAHLSIEQGVRLPALRQVQTLSEALPAGLRDLCREAWGVSLADLYSAAEVGYMAIQCPEHEHYHVQSETCVVEVLDDAGQPCAPGQVGRVVVTPLHNFAMPLIRYEVGDLAEVGEPCPCGRGLPVLNRVLGRQRSMLMLPDGRRFWPYLGETLHDASIPVRQFQVVQRRPDTLHVSLVVARPVTADEEQQLRTVMLDRLGHPFRLVFDYVDHIPRGANGKFEDVRCEIAAADASSNGAEIGPAG